MKKGKKFYLITWVVAVLVFNLIMFLLPDKLIDPTEGSFWVIYITVTLSFLGQAACSFFYAQKKDKKERFLLIPIVYVSYIALLMTLLLALEALTLQFLPLWFNVIVAVVVLAYYAFAVFRTLAAAEMVMEVEKKVEQSTEFIRMMTAKAKALEESAPEEFCPLVKKIYESLRYSDPMSSGAVAELDAKIREKYELFTDAIKKNAKTEAEEFAEELCVQIKERNEVCKVSKR